jgi:hypothetical protein
VPVPAKGNSQMKFLLCAARAHMGEVAREKDFYGTIVQPRLYYEETVRFSHVELDAFEAELRHAIHHGRYSNDPYAIGPHCRFCSAIAICPKQMTRLEEIATLREVEGDVTYILNAREDLQKMISEAEKLATKMLRDGLTVPGYKLVQKTGNRTWTDEKNAERWLSRRGVPASARRKITLKSPNQIEQMRPDLKSGLKRYWENPDRGTGLAPETDKRPAIVTGENLDQALAEALANHEEG